MDEWQAIQQDIIIRGTARTRILALELLEQKLTRKELQDLALILNLEVMERNERKQKRKILRLAEYKEYNGETATEPPEGQEPNEQKSRV